MTVSFSYRITVWSQSIQHRRRLLYVITNLHQASNDVIPIRLCSHTHARNCFKWRCSDFTRVSNSQIPQIIITTCPFLHCKINCPQFKQRCLQSSGKSLQRNCGKLFHTRGAATAKWRVPSTVLVLGTTRHRLSADQMCYTPPQLWQVCSRLPDMAAPAHVGTCTWSSPNNIVTSKIIV